MSDDIKGGKAVAFTGANQSIKFLDQFIKEYIGQENYFSEYFLRLGEYEDFKKLCDRAWLSVLKELPKSGGKAHPSKTTDNSFFTHFVEQLSNFQMRLGVYLKEKVMDQLRELSNDFTSPEIKTVHTLSRDENIDQKVELFSFENSNDIRLGSIEEKSNVGDVNKETICVLNTKKNTKGAIFHHMENHLLDAISQLSDRKYAEEESKKSVDAFNILLKGYKKWIYKSSHDVKKALGSTYKSLIQNLEMCMSYFDGKIEGQNNEEETDSIREVLQEHIENIREIEQKLRDSSYEGKSFPSFPGIIRSSDVRALSPNSGTLNEINISRYLLPLCGSGWDKTSNKYNLLIDLFFRIHLVSNSNNELFKKSVYLENVKEKITQFFRQLEININQLTLEKYELLQNLMSREGRLQELHELVVSSTLEDTEYTFLEFLQGQGKKEKIKFKSEAKIKTDGVQHVLVINNKRKAEHTGKYGWDYDNFDTLPEIIVYLLVNGGLWPKTVKIHVLDTNLYVSNQKWKSSQNKDFFRWLKATIDSIVLRSIMNGEIALFTGNSFFDFNKEDELMIIPVLNYSKNRTSTHTYYYGVLDGVLAQNTIFNNTMSGSISDDTYYNQLNATSEEEMYSFLDKNFQVKLDKKNQDQSISRINIQHFNKLELYTRETFKRKFHKNLPILKNPEFVQPILEALKAEGYGVDSLVTYTTGSQSKGRSETSNKLVCVTFLTKGKDRTIILPLLFFLFLIENLGRSSGKPLSSLYNKLNRNNYRESIAEFMGSKHIQNSLPRLSGQLFNVSAETGLGRIMKSNISVWRTDSSILLENSNTQIFYVLHIEPQLVQSYGDSEKDVMIKVLVMKYSTNEAPRIIFNEYFLCDRNKNHHDYRALIERIIILIMVKLDEYVFISIKNLIRVGEYLAETQDISTSQRVWNKFRGMSQEAIDGAKEAAKINKLFGYVNKFCLIPLTVYKTKTGQDLHFWNWEFETAFVKGGIEPEIEKYQFFNLLLSRPKTRSYHFKGTEESDEEISDFNVYSYLDVIVNLQSSDSKLPEESIQRVQELLKLGLLLGGEATKVGTVGFSRLFHYPYPDAFRNVFSPALLLKGVDFFVLR